MLHRQRSWSLSVTTALCWIWQSVTGQNCELTTPAFTAYADSIIQQEMQKQQVVGLSAAIIRNGEVVYMKGHGYADRDYQIPAGVATMYRFASLSKTITATAVLQAWQKGQLDLIADVRTYVPEYPVKPEGPISVEQLLSCEAGIQQYNQETPYSLENQVRYILEHPASYDPIAATGIFAEQQLMAVPGTKFNYSTFSFNLLGAALARATGTPYEKYIDENIIRKMNLPYLQPEFRAERPYPQQAAWYRVVDGVAIADKGTGFDYEDVSWKLPGGGYTGTIVDLAGFARSLMNDSLLSAPVLQKMFTVREIKGRPTWYGNGVFLSKKNGLIIASQFGHQAGARSILYMSPSTKDAVLMLSNTYGTDLLPAAQAIMDKLLTLAPPDTFCDNPFPNTLEKVTWVKKTAGDTLLYREYEARWNKVPNAFRYEVQWDTDKAFSSPRATVIQDAGSTVLRKLPEATTVYVRVRALNKYLYGGIKGPWSEVQRFTTGTELPIVHLPYRNAFNGSPFVHMGDTLIQYTNGVSWRFQQTDKGLRIRGGSLSLAEKNGGWTLDVFPGNTQASGYLIMECRLDAALLQTLLLHIDFLLHGDPTDRPQLMCWVRGSLQDPWVHLPEAIQVKGNTGTIDADIVRSLSEYGQTIGANTQIRLGFYGGNDAFSYAPQPAVTLLDCLLTGK